MLLMVVRLGGGVIIFALVLGRGIHNSMYIIRHILPRNQCTDLLLRCMNASYMYLFGEFARF